MRALKTLFSVVCVSLALGACSSSYDEARDGNPDYVQRVDFEDRIDEDVQSYDFGDLDLDNLPTPQEVFSGGNVEVLSLDANAVPETEVTPAYTPLATAEPSVEIIPLDDEMARELNIPLRPNNPAPVSSVDAQLLSPTPNPTPLAGSGEREYISLRTSGGDGVRVYFNHDSTQPDAQSEQAIQSLISRMRNDGRIYSIEGHASREASIDDPLVRKLVNLKISMERAYSVSRMLIEAGIPARQIQTVGFGENFPSLSTDGRDATAASRRVEILPASGS